jgi:hypothetical protein
VLEPYLVQLHLQLFGDQHRDRCVCALAHLDIGHGQDDLPVAIHADEGVGREWISFGRHCFAARERQSQAQQKAAAGGCTRLQKTAPGQVVRGCRRMDRFGGLRINATEDHNQPPCRSIARPA